LFGEIVLGLQLNIELLLGDDMQNIGMIMQNDKVIWFEKFQSLERLLYLIGNEQNIDM
jgi:hypothetical protein